MNYYNENDPKAVAWLRELIDAQLIPAGHIDTRSILDVHHTDLAGFTQCHFFAGVAGWPLAFALAGWPADRPVWSGSCPCQPFSVAGRGVGHADERHLWPALYALIAECGAAAVFGEQVASPLGREWLAGVRADVEGIGYALGAADLCAPGVGAPHRRQRLFWVANARGRGQRADRGARQLAHPEQCREIDGVADADGSGQRSLGATLEKSHVEQCEQNGGVGLTDGAGRQPRRLASEAGGHRDSAGFWSGSILIPCRDGKARRIESGTFPLVNGIPSGLVPGCDPGVEEAQATAEARVMRLRGYGNAIIPQLAAVFITAAMDLCQ